MLMNTDIIRCYLEIIDKFRFYYFMNIRERVNFYSPWNCQKTYGFLMISGGIEVDLLVHIRSELESDHPLFKLSWRDHLQISLTEAKSCQLIRFYFL